MKTNINLDAPWVVFQGQIYRADHKPAPFTSTEGVEYPDFHTGLVALAYTDEDKRAIAALPDIIKALHGAIHCLAWHINQGHGVAMDSQLLKQAIDILASVKGEPTP